MKRQKLFNKTKQNKKNQKETLELKSTLTKRKYSLQGLNIGMNWQKKKSTNLKINQDCRIQRIERKWNQEK